MPAILLPILAKILPFIIGAIALVGAYFGIKRKGTVEERERQAERVREAQKEVDKAVSQDSAIDAKALEKIDALPKANIPSDLKPGDPFSF